MKLRSATHCSGKRNLGSQSSVGETKLLRTKKLLLSRSIMSMVAIGVSCPYDVVQTKISVKHMSIFDVWRITLQSIPLCGD